MSLSRTIQQPQQIVPLLLMTLAVAVLMLTPAATRNSGGLGEVAAPIVGSAISALNNLPLGFEANHGQVSSQVRFTSRAGGFTTFLTADGAVFARTQGEETSALYMTFAGGSADPAIVPGEALPGASNYFIGSNPNAWRTGIPTYSSVQYREVYPGIDAVFYGNPGQLQFDFIVSPGASPDVIRMSFAGADSLRLDSNGNLIATVGAAEFVQSAPYTYQETDGTRTTVDGSFVILSDNQAGFEIGAYDTSKTLVIDPVLIFGSYLGGGNDDRGWGIAVDMDGNVYVTGQTQSTNFPVTPGSFSQTFTGETSQPNVFVTKINPSGTAILYSTYLGGTGGDVGYDIEVDSEGQAFVVGDSGSTGFPTTPGAIANAGAFVTKLSADGSELVYSTRLGSNTQLFGVVIDDDGRAYVAGVSFQANFPATAGSFQPNLAGNGDGIVGVLNEDGTGLVWGSYIGGSGREFAYDVARDAGGHVYVTGVTPSDDFPTVNAFQNTKAAGADAFVAKFTPDGSALVYSTYLGGDDGSAISDIGFGIDADAAGNAYVTGHTWSTNFPVSANRLQDHGGSSDAFVTKFGPNGNMVYSTYLGGSNVERGAGIVVDAQGNAHVAGHTVSANFPTADPFQASNAGGADAFVAKLNASGTSLIYSTYLGGSGTDRIGHLSGNPDGGAIALDALGNIYVTGTTDSTDFPTMNPFQAANAGAEDAFVVKLVSEGLVWGDVNCNAGLNAVDALGNLRHIAGLPVTQTEPCPDIGTPVVVTQIAGGIQAIWGDVNCDGGVNAVDALMQLRHIAALSVTQTQPCPVMGSIIQILN